MKKITHINTQELILKSELVELHKFFAWIDSMNVPEGVKEDCREKVRFRISIVNKALSELKVLS